MAEFQTAYKKTSQWEGGYVNDPKDRGGETYAGISRKFHPNWKGWTIVDRNKPIKKGDFINSDELNSLVKQFYYTNFWQPIKGDYIENQDVANFVYDWYVNSGISAIKSIQKSIGVSVDGKVGKETIEALEQVNLQALKSYRLQFVKNIVKKDPSQSKFLKGWTNRINSF